MIRFTQVVSRIFLTALLAGSLLLSNTLAAQAVPDSIPDLVPEEVIEPVAIDTLMFSDDEDFDEEYEEGTAVAPSSDKNYFSEKGSYSPQVYRQRRLNAGEKSRLKNDPDFWYADFSFQKKKEQIANDKPWLQSDTAQFILWALIITGFALVIYLYLRSNNVSLFRRTQFIRGESAEPDTEDIFSINYEQEISKATASGNYRLATRLLFLRLLRTLSDRNHIQYKQDRTNLDYLMQLSGKPVYQEFFRLTRHYEYAWYGQFEVDQQRFSRIHAEFDQLFQNLRGR